MNYNQFKNAILKQSALKEHCLNLIASENIPSAAMRSVLNTNLDNRYPLCDFPNNNFLREIIIEIENKLCTLFGCQYADCSPLSGMNSMELILAALTEANDNVYIIPPMAGGHASTANNCSSLGLNVHYLPISPKSQFLNEEELEKRFDVSHPKVIYLDNTLICFYRDPTSIVRISHKYGAYVVYDASQVLGLIAGKAFPNPLDSGIDCMCGSTHKTFPGPQKAIILSNNISVIQRLKSVAVDFISSVHTNAILALYVATLEMQEYGQAYAKQIIANSKALGESLQKRGVCVPTYNFGITQTHQVWIQVDEPQTTYKKLSKYGICTNSMRIPEIEGIGIRLGTAEVTRLGMKESEMEVIADCIADVINNHALKKVRTRIGGLLRNFDRVLFSIDEKQLFNIIYSQDYHFHKVKNVDFDAIIDDFEENILQPLEKYCGMIIRGGVGRGTADKYSDIDFTCFFDVEDVETYRKNAGLLRGMFRYKGVMFSARYMSVYEFVGEEWSEKMKHAYQFSKPIRCSKEIIDTLNEKTKMSYEERRRRVLLNLIDLGEMCKIYPKLGDFEMFSEVYKHYKRKEYMAAHATIDVALKYIKNILFSLNGIYYPEEKSYYISFFSNLPIQPLNIDRYIDEILQMPRNKDSIMERLDKLVSLSRMLLKFIKERISIPEDLYRYVMNN